MKNEKQHETLKHKENMLFQHFQENIIKNK